jgi:hypothetical protein
VTSARDSERESRERDHQRKLAEQLAGRVGTSPDEIEKGVEGFIEKSRQALGEGELKPPYRRPSWYDDFFELIKQRTIEEFSLAFIRLNIASGSEAYKFRAGLRFLGLIDDQGRPTDKLSKLRVTGEGFRENLEKIIRQAYSGLFRTVIVEKARPESVINFMIEKYDYSRPLAEEATALFTYFCSKAGIPLSEELASFQAPTREGYRSPSPKAPSRKKAEPKKVEEYDDSYATLRSDVYSVAVKKDVESIDFAREHINSFLDYWKKKIIEESRK